MVGRALRSVEGVRDSARARASFATNCQHRPGSWSAPTRGRTGSPGSCCSIWSAWGSRHLEAAGDGVPALAGRRRSSSSQGPAARAGQPSGSGPTRSASPAPWVLPRVWPPTISAAVSSSFIAIRPNVSRMSVAAASGSGLPSGPFGIDVDQAHRDGAVAVLELPVAAVALVAEPGVFGAPDRSLRAPRCLVGRRRSRMS